MIKNVNDTKYSYLWKALGGFNLLISVPSENSFLCRVREENKEFDQDEASSWYKQVTS